MLGKIKNFSVGDLVYYNGLNQIYEVISVGAITTIKNSENKILTTPNKLKHYVKYK